MNDKYILIQIIKYNGLDDFLSFIYEQIRSEVLYKINFDIINDFLNISNIECRNKSYNRKYYYGQCELVWMYLVLKFGEFGTSPRSGWIPNHNFHSLKNFIDNLEIWEE